MRITRLGSSSRIALLAIASLAACAGADVEEQALFDVERTDVALVTIDGELLKLNLSHGLLFSEQLGYASLSDRELRFAPELRQDLYERVSTSEALGSATWQAPDIEAGGLVSALAALTAQQPTLQQASGGGLSETCTTTVGTDGYTCTTCTTKHSTFITCVPTKKVRARNVTRSP